MRKMKTYGIDIRVEVTNIKVQNRYYSYDYVVFINGKEYKREKDYEGSHNWDDNKHDFRIMLRQGLAAQNILESLRINLKK